MLYCVPDGCRSPGACGGLEKVKSRLSRDRICYFTSHANKRPHPRKDFKYRYTLFIYLDRNTGFILCVSTTTYTDSTLLFHIHNLPEGASFAIILRATVTCPPVLVHFMIMLHIGPQDGRYSTLASWYSFRPKVRSIKSECDVDTTV